MNNQMTAGIFRHSLTVVAGAVMAHGSSSLDTAVPTLINNIASGDINAIVAASVVVLSVLWSMWVKATEATKQVVVNTLTFKGKE
jgi:hypothetical protein